MDASQQFWLSDDLLEHLLPMLDLPTMKNLASVNPLAVSVLSRPPMWRRILKRTYQRGLSYDPIDGDWPREELESFRQEAPKIADLLKMLEDQQSGLHELLDYVCEAFPLPEFGAEVKLRVCGRSRPISGRGFMFMESVVSYLEVNVMEVEEFSFEETDDVEWDLLLDALVSHVPRQQREVNSIKIPAIEIELKSDSEKLFAILGKSTSWSIGSLFIDWELGHEFWTKWAELAAKGKIRRLHVYPPHGRLGCPEAMRKVWLAVTEEISTDIACIFKSEGENGWAWILTIIEEEERMATRKRKRDTDDE